jgi:YspA, cpYpsA-related SLOG family
VIIGVTGSRDWRSREIISRAFDEAFTDFGDPAYPDIIIEGGAGGADAICRIEANSRGWHVATVRAIWGFYGPQKAGHIRNDAMIYLGMNADAWLGFINPCIRKDCPLPKPHDSHGTSQCLGSARKAGISVREYRDG